MPYHASPPSIPSQEFKARGLAIIVDDLSPSPHAVLVMAAETASVPLLNELITLAKGLTYVALSPRRRQAFELEEMSRPRVSNSPASLERDDFSLCVSVEAREGVSTGISAADRAKTVAILGEASPNHRKLVKPGHIFPVEVREGGVLVKNALPEGALDLVKLSGFSDAAAFSDILSETGSFATDSEIKALATAREIPLVALSSITRFRLETEKLVEKIAEARLPTRIAGELRSCIYKSKVHEGEHVALIKEPIDFEKPVLVRVQAEFTCADVFGGAHPPTRAQLHAALHAIAQNGSGILVYLRRPMGGELREQINSWEGGNLKQPVSMIRQYGLGAQVLRELGVKKIELLTGSQKSLVGLTSFGIEIVAQRRLNLDFEREELRRDK